MKKVIFIIITFFTLIINVNAASNKIKDVGIELNETDIKLMQFDKTTWQSNPDNTNIVSTARSVDTAEEMEIGKDYSIFYPNSLSYLNKTLSIRVSAKLISKGGSIPKIYISTSGNTANQIVVNWPDGATSTNIEWEISLYDSNGDPFKSNAITGIYDPDESAYLFNTTDRFIYFIKADPIANNILEEFGNFEDALIVKNDGVYPTDKNGVERGANYKDGLLLTNLNNESKFKFSTLTYTTGSLSLPYFYELLKPFKITYELNGGTNNSNNPISYISGEEKDILDPTRDGYVFLGWEEGNKIYKTDFGDKHFTAKWEKIEYKIETEVVNGKIDDSVTVQPGENVTIKYQPNDGYILDKIIVDNEEIETKDYKDSYLFSEVLANHKIRVEYIKVGETPIDNPKTGTISLLFTLLAGAGIFLIYKKTKNKSLINKI